MPNASILQLFGYYDYAGISRVAVDLSLRLAKSFNITLACRKIVRKPEDNIEIIELAPKNTLDLWKKLKDMTSQFDIIHSHDVYSLPGLSGDRKAKVVYTDHGIVPLRYSTTMMKSLHGTLFAHFCRFFAREVDVSVGISDYIVDELKRRVGCKNVIKIPNGVYLEKFRPIDKLDEHLKLDFGDPMLLKVGLIENHRAIDYHISSMPFILKKFPRASLVFIGKGSNISHYKERVQAMGLGDHIHFLGWISHKILPLYYNAADIILQVDYCHGFGLPTLEGMACGKPVIARDAYAMREHLQKSGAGVLVQGKDPHELVVAIERILDNYDFYASKAREYAAHFSWENVATKYKEVYKRLLIEDY